MQDARAYHGGQDVQQAERGRGHGQTPVRVHDEEPSCPADQQEQAQRRVAARFHGALERGQGRRDPAAPLRENCRRPDEQDRQDDALVPLDIRDDHLHGVAEGVAGKSDEHAPDHGAHPVEQREGQGCGAGRAIGHRDRDAEPVKDPRGRDQDVSAALEPAVHALESPVFSQFAVEERTPARAGEPEPALVGQRVGDDGEDDDGVEAEVAAVREKRSGQQEGVGLDHDAQKQQQVAVSQEFVFEHTGVPGRRRHQPATS